MQDHEKGKPKAQGRCNTDKDTGTRGVKSIEVKQVGKLFWYSIVCSGVQGTKMGESRDRLNGSREKQGVACAMQCFREAERQVVQSWGSGGKAAKWEAIKSLVFISRNVTETRRRDVMKT